MSAKVLIPIGIGAAAVVGLYYAAQTKATAEDLKITVEKVDFNPFKDIRGGEAVVDVILGFGNARKGKIVVEALDLSFFLGDNRVGGLRDYKFNTTIDPVAFTTKPIKARFPMLQLGKALGLSIVRLIVGLGSGPKDPAEESLLKRTLPKEIKVTGPIRANGMTFQIDEIIPLNVKFK